MTNDMAIGGLVGALVVLAGLGLASMFIEKGPPVDELRARPVQELVAEHHVSSTPTEVDGPPSIPSLNRKPPALKKSGSKGKSSSKGKSGSKGKSDKKGKKGR